jgi:hypothetical protein
MTPNLGVEPGRREEERWHIGEAEESSSRNSLNPVVSNSPVGGSYSGMRGQPCPLPKARAGG